MTDRPATTALQPWTGPGIREFIALMAALMAANAFAIDSMLPALPAIGESLHVADGNDRQLVVTAFMLGFGVAQLFYGPLSDRFGRKRILAGSLACYVACSLLVGLSASFTLLLAARVVQGVAAAGARVLVVSIVRDRYEGPAMARVMSITMIVFMLIPVLAPTIGQGVLMVASWRYIFFLLAAYAFVVLVWLLVRLPETLAPAKRRPLSVAAITEGVQATLTHRLSIGNTVALTLVIGSLLAFINSIQQIVFEVFKRPDLLGLVFAAIAAPMAVSSYLNSAIVERFGSRMIMIVGLCLFAGLAALHLAIGLLLGESILVFVVLQACTMACFGLVSSNMGALAMEPLGHVAGTASSVQGVITSVGGALIGLFIGQQFNGTTIPMLVGFVVCGVLGLMVAIWANPAGVRGATAA